MKKNPKRGKVKATATGSPRITRSPAKDLVPQRAGRCPQEPAPSGHSDEESCPDCHCRKCADCERCTLHLIDSTTYVVIENRALYAALRSLVEYIGKVGGYMKPEDMKTYRQAQATLEEFRG